MLNIFQESAETFSFRVDKAWRQRCSQRFRNILDMIAKKAKGNGAIRCQAYEKLTQQNHWIWFDFFCWLLKIHVK